MPVLRLAASPEIRAFEDRNCQRWRASHFVNLALLYLNHPNLRYAGSKNWKSPTENSYEELALGNASLGFEKGTELATAKKMTDRPATERSRKTVNWIFAIVAILIYVIFRILEQYS